MNNIIHIIKQKGNMASTPYMNQFDALLSDSDDECQKVTQNQITKSSRRNRRRLSTNGPKMSLTKKTHNSISLSKQPKLNYSKLIHQASNKNKVEKKTETHTLNFTSNNKTYNISKKDNAWNTNDDYFDDRDTRVQEDFNNYMDTMLDGYEYEIFMREEIERKEDESYYNQSYSDSDGYSSY